MLQKHDSRRYLSLLIMSESSEDEMVALILLVAAEEKRKKIRKKREVWVKPWLQRRVLHGPFDTPGSRLPIPQ